MFSRCIADFACLYIEPAAAHPAMVDLPSHQVAAHFASAKRALLHHLLCHDASIFDLKLVATMPAVIYLARTHNAADGSLTKRARVVECVVRVLLGTARGRQLSRLSCASQRRAMHRIHALSYTREASSGRRCRALALQVGGSGIALPYGNRNANANAKYHDSNWSKSRFPV